jgi:hypothetical protein
MSIEQELGAHRAYGCIRERRAFAEQLEGDRMATGKPLAWVLSSLQSMASILESEDAAGEPVRPGLVASRARSYCRKAKPPKYESPPGHIEHEQRRRKGELGDRPKPEPEPEPERMPRDESMAAIGGLLATLKGAEK